MAYDYNENSLKFHIATDTFHSVYIITKQKRFLIYIVQVSLQYFYSPDVWLGKKIEFSEHFSLKKEEERM